MTQMTQQADFRLQCLKGTLLGLKGTPDTL